MILYLLASTNKCKVGVMFMIVMNLLELVFVIIIENHAPLFYILLPVLWSFAMTVFINNCCDSKSSRWAFLILMTYIVNLAIAVCFNNFGLGLINLTEIEVGIALYYLILACALFSMFCYWNIVFSEPFLGQNDGISLSMTSSFGEAVAEVDYSPINKYGLAYLVGIALCFILF